MASTVPVAESKRRHCLSLEDKVKLLKELDGGEDQKTSLARKFGISKSTLSTIIATRAKIESAFRTAKFSPNRKRLRVGKYSRLEDGLFLWYEKESRVGANVADWMLERKAKQLAQEMNIEDFCASSGWLNRFKDRKGISRVKGISKKNNLQETFKKKRDFQLPVRTSSRYSNGSAEENENFLAEFMSWHDSTNWTDAVLPDLLRTYSPANIFSVTETGLFFRCLPVGMNHFRGQTCSGGEHASERLTIITAVNLDGSCKLPIFCVGKGVSPKCLNGIKNLPITYRTSNKAWMTSSLFSEWILGLEGQFLSEGRKVAMLVDTSPTHVQPGDLHAIDLIFLPPHTSRNLQSQDKGIVYVLKQRYREEMLKKLILHLEFTPREIQHAQNDRRPRDRQLLSKPSANLPGPFHWTLLDAMHGLRKTWDSISPETVRSCFIATGFSIPEADISSGEVALSSRSHQLHDMSLFQRVSANIPVDMSLVDYVNVDRRVVTWDQMGMVSRIISTTCANQLPVCTAGSPASQSCHSPNSSLSQPSVDNSHLFTSRTLKMANGTSDMNGFSQATQADATAVTQNHCGSLFNHSPTVAWPVGETSLPGNHRVEPFNSTLSGVKLTLPRGSEPMPRSVSSEQTARPVTNGCMFTSVASLHDNNKLNTNSHEITNLSKENPQGCVEMAHKFSPGLAKAETAIAEAVAASLTDDANPTMPAAPSISQAHNALLMLRRFLERTPAPENDALDMFQCLGKLEDFVIKHVLISPRQTSILDYFPKHKS